MNDSAKTSHYQSRLDDVFGTGAVLLNNTRKANVFLDALATNRFPLLGPNFKARLQRLNAVYPTGTDRIALLRQVSLVADPTNWQGAYAELAAFDFFTHNNHYLGQQPALDHDLDVARSLGVAFGNKSCNLDLAFLRYEFYTDVKVLKDNVSEILESVYTQVWPVSRPLILASYPYDGHPGPIRDNLTGLKEFLREQVGGKRPTRIDCGVVVPRLQLVLQWEPGVAIAESSYEPYRHAENFHRLPFTEPCVKKFVTDRPFFLTYVVSRLFHSKIDAFQGSNRTFYRALARRAFCQYRQCSTRLREWLPSFESVETVWEVSQHLSGLLFIEDQCIDSPDPGQPNVTGFFYQNPNAHHRLLHTNAHEYMVYRVQEWDDFMHDNY